SCHTGAIQAITVVGSTAPQLVTIQLAQHAITNGCFAALVPGQQQLVILHQREAGRALHLSGCSNVDVSNVWIRACAGYGFSATGCKDVVLDSLDVVPATNRPRSSAADGINV